MSPALVAPAQAATARITILLQTVRIAPVHPLLLRTHLPVPHPHRRTHHQSRSLNLSQNLRPAAAAVVLLVQAAVKKTVAQKMSRLGRNERISHVKTCLSLKILGEACVGIILFFVDKLNKNLYFEEMPECHQPWCPSSIISLSLLISVLLSPH